MTALGFSAYRRTTVPCLDRARTMDPAAPAAAFPRPSRREMLQIGFSTGLGLSAASLPLRAAANPGVKPVKSVVFVFLTGAPSQIDTFDMKPEAPAEIRGEFKPIATNVPGVMVCEHLPLMAQRMDRLAVVRSVRCDRSLGAHDFATHAILSGIDIPPTSPRRVASRADWPCFAAGLDILKPRGDGLPSGVNLPIYLDDGGVGPYPGQNAGLLGAKHDPMQIRQNPAQPDFAVAGMSLPAGLPLERLAARRKLLSRLERTREATHRLDPSGAFASQQTKATEVLAAGRLARAFAIEQEPDRVRERYGRHVYGQSLLLARRLVQVGVPIVQVNLGNFTAHWDTHMHNFKMLKEVLLPPFDKAATAFLDDLVMTGLFDETLVLMMGEFGRTPKVGGNVGMPEFSPTGRDHWCDCFFALFAGGGVRGGQLVGASDARAAYPATTPYNPSDIGATIYAALGADPTREVVDRLGRPFRLNTGAPMTSLYTGG